MLALEDLERSGYHTVVVATPDTQGRPVGRQIPLRRFLVEPLAGVEVSSYALVYDLAGIPLEDSPFAGAQTGYHDIRLRPDLTTLRPYPGASGTAICLADVVDAAGKDVLALRAQFSAVRLRLRERQGSISVWRPSWSSISSGMTRAKRDGWAS